MALGKSGVQLVTFTVELFDIDTSRIRYASGEQEGARQMFFLDLKRLSEQAGTANDCLLDSFCVHYLVNLILSIAAFTGAMNLLDWRHKMRAGINVAM